MTPASSTDTDPATAPLDTRFFGHPRALATLAFTEGFIGFSYYGMQSLLVLYMAGYLLQPGHIGNVLGFGPFRALLNSLYGRRDGAPLASSIMGLYAALVYATPIIGGLVADRLLGATRTIILGAVLMTIGHFLMAFDASFLIALACLVAGMGCGGTLKAQVGSLYPPADLRRASAFQIYTLSINIAVILAPLICGTLGENYAWHWGFVAAGLGMLVGLAVYLAGLRGLPPERPIARVRTASGGGLSRADWRALAVLAALLPVLAVSAVGNMEIFNGYLIWGKANYALMFFGRLMPVSWLLSLDAFVSTFTLLGSLLFWRWWSSRHRDPDEIVKIAIGASISAFAPLILAAAAWHARGGHKVGLAWGLAFHIINDIGFSNVYGIGLALYSRASPRGLGATVVNSYSLHLFLANLLVGWLAGLLSQMPAVQFWLLHAALIAAAALVLMLFARVFRATLAPTAAASMNRAVISPTAAG